MSAVFLTVLALLQPLLLQAEPASDKDWSLSLRHRVSAGVSWRTGSPDPSLIGKASLDPALCASDDCIGMRASDTAPNARFLAAPGALSSNTDDGNLNFERGDVVAAAAKWNPELSVQRGDWRLFASGLAFYDPVNDRLRQFYPNQIVAPGPQPGQAMSAERGAGARRAAGRDFQLREAYLRYDTLFGDSLPFRLGVGRQILLWGNAALATQGTLNFINPPDVNNLARPGARLAEALQPVGMAVLQAGPLAGIWSFEAFYQYEWRPYGFPARGTLQSFFDAGNEAEAGDHVVGLFGKTPNDPGQLGTPASPALASISASSYSLLRAANRTPRDGGQYGVALHAVIDDWAEGAEVGLYYANYHSRLPTVSALAAPASCTRREGNARGRDTANGLQFLEDCGIPFVDRPGVDFEALPVDGARWLLEYPEDLQLFGLSLGLETGGWLIQAEAAWRPDQPVQVDMEDVLFAAVQPALPRQDLDLISLAPGFGTGSFVLPSSRRAAPDFVSAYRGLTPGEVAPGAYIRGYERMPVMQAMLGFTRVLGARQWPGADQAALILELQADWLPELPDVQSLQFEGPGTHTHASPGVAESGDALRVNPLQNREGYVTRFAWGYRLGLAMHYANVLGLGWNLEPFLLLSHDVDGVGPGLAENFLEKRRIMIAALGLVHGPWRVDLAQLIHAGAGQRNLLRDRDQFTLAVSLEF